MLIVLASPPPYDRNASYSRSPVAQRDATRSQPHCQIGMVTLTILETNKKTLPAPAGAGITEPAAVAAGRPLRRPSFETRAPGRADRGSVPRRKGLGESPGPATRWSAR